MVFFSSYAYMQEAFEEMNKKSLDAVLLIQEPNMDEDAREGFLQEFRSDRERPVIGFAVLGGIFSEGIDLKGDRLEGVMVIGVGLPQLSRSRKSSRTILTR